MQDVTDHQVNSYLFNYILATGDNLLISGHRLSEWCGHAPILEEDIALGNIALDCLGQASALLQLAAEVEGKNRTEDDLAFFRDPIDYKNLLITELPKGDFAFTIMRLCLFDTFYFYLLEDLQSSSFSKLAGIAEKSLKEIKYHLRHANEWLIRLGNGTEESHERTQKALDELWMYTGEMFMLHENDTELINIGFISDYSKIKSRWEIDIQEILKKTELKIPDQNQYMVSGGRRGMHTEHLGHLLSEMQIVARSYPGVKW